MNWDSWYMVTWMAVVNVPALLGMLCATAFDNRWFFVVGLAGTFCCIVVPFMDSVWQGRIDKLRKEAKR